MVKKFKSKGITDDKPEPSQAPPAEGFGRFRVNPPVEHDPDAAENLRRQNQRLLEQNERLLRERKP